MFTREEAADLLTAEKLAARLTDALAAHLATTALDKVRAVLRRPDRDYLHALAPHLHVLPPAGRPHRQCVPAAGAGTHWRTKLYNCTISLPPRPHRSRAIEPIGLYFAQHRHVVAYCRLRQAFRNFRLDRIQQLTLSAESFAERPETFVVVGWKWTRRK